MGAWNQRLRAGLRRLGPVLVSAAEAYLAAWVLLTAWLLQAIQTGVESGAYNREAAGGFAFWSLLFWVLSSLGLVVLVGCHATFRMRAAVRDGGYDRVIDSLPRPAIELLVSVVLAVGLFSGGTTPQPFHSLLLASAVMGLAVLLHVVIDLGQFVRVLLASIRERF